MTDFNKKIEAAVRHGAHVITEEIAEASEFTGALTAREVIFLALDRLLLRVFALEAMAERAEARATNAEARLDVLEDPKAQRKARQRKVGFPKPSPRDWATFEGVEVVHITKAAVGVKFGKTGTRSVCYFPVSTISEDSEINEDSQVPSFGSLTVRVWIAQDKGLR